MHHPTTRRSTGTLAALALGAASLLWGTSFVATKPVLAETSPILLAWLRFLIAAAVLVPLCRRAGCRPPLGRREALLGLTGFAVYFLCQNLGLRMATASDATLVLTGGQVCLTALAGRLLLRERIGAGSSAGLACVVAGIAVVGVGAGDGPGSSTACGLLLLAGAAAAAALHTVLGRRAFAGAELLPVLTGGTLYGALFLSLPTAAEVAATGLALPDGRELGLLLYLGVGCSALAFALSAYGLRHLSALQNGVLGNLELLVGIGAAALLLGERIGLGEGAGGVLVLTGVVVASAPAGAVRWPRPGAWWVTRRKLAPARGMLP